MSLFALWSVWVEAAWWQAHETARAIRLMSEIPLSEI